MSLVDNLAKQFGQTATPQIGQAVEELVEQAISQRKPHERRWYDNNFFDDGYHFRTISKKTGAVIDHTKKSTGYVERAIPRASRQIRGVSNLLFAAEPYPVVYPERVTVEQFRDPQTGQVDQQAYAQEMEKSKQIARKRGMWLTTEWDDEQQLPIKLIDLILLAAKNSIAYLQIYSETEKQKICTDVFDAFDIIVFGDRRELKDLPFITKATPMDIKEIQASPLFDPAMVKKLTPDNKYATSEIKDAYMRARYGSKNTQDKKDGSVIVKETFMKEYLSESNWKEAVRLGEENGAMEGKSKGDMIMRHPFSAGGVTLKDEYVDYDEYPFADFRFEPGPLYQVPFIERFIPQNKSIDIVVTRLEKWVNAMIVGVYQKRKGENFQVSNFPGGQIMEYETTPLSQMNVASVGNTPFNVIEILNKYLDEQGATTSGGINVPQGVKSGVAIESIKSTEYANLKISTLMLKHTIKTIAERMLERADKDYLKPVEVSSMEDGEPDYFDVIGKRGAQLHEKLDQQLPPDTIVLDKSVKVRVEIEPGLGLTMEGKRQAMQSIIEYIIKLTTAVPGIVTPEALQQIIKRFLETFGYGSTQELMEAMEEGITQAQMTDQSIMQMKIAIIEALKDAGAVGPEMENRLVDSTKVGVLEAMHDAGLTDKQNPEQPQQELNKITTNFKDLPPDGKAQAAALAGVHLDAGQIAADEAQDKAQEQQMAQKEMQLKEKAINTKAQKPAPKAA